MKFRIKHYEGEYKDVIAFLADGRWHKAPEIQKATGVNTRLIRSIGEKTGAIIGSGEGYKRTDLASSDEIDHAEKSLQSRASKMLARLKAMQEFRGVPE